jgi:hypothetical protein
MPLNKKYKKNIKSSIADIKNIGERGGGSITAALFLQVREGEMMPSHDTTLTLVFVFVVRSLWKGTTGLTLTWLGLCGTVRDTTPLAMVSSY